MEGTISREQAATRLKNMAMSIATRAISGQVQVRRDCDKAVEIMRKWAKLLEMPTSTLAEWNERSLELDRMLNAEVIV